jgi:hypothetical protein
MNGMRRYAALSVVVLAGPASVNLTTPTYPSSASRPASKSFTPRTDPPSTAELATYWPGTSVSRASPTLQCCDGEADFRRDYSYAAAAIPDLDGMSIGELLTVAQRFAVVAKLSD